MATHRYWRLNLTASGGGAYSFAECQFRTTAGTSLLFSGGTASAADTFGGAPGTYDASKATDNNTATLYSSNSKTAPQWLMYDFGATSTNWRDVVEITMTSRPDTFDQTPTAFDIQWSDNNSTWTTQVSVFLPAWTGTTQTQVVSALPTSAPGGGGGGGTTWNPADKTTFINLSNGNLTATTDAANGFGVQSVRSIYSAASGKYYWENTFVNIGNEAVGIANGTVALSSLGSSGGVGSAVVNQSGGVNVNGVSSGAIASFVNGGVVCVAIDMTAKLIWFRNGAAGQWNNSGPANPATGVGGLSLTGMAGAGVAVYALMTGSNSLGGVITANFGGIVFTGFVPTGYDAGFPASGGAVVAGAQARALVLA